MPAGSGLASSGREACPNTYRHPEGAHIHIAELQLGSAPTVFSSSARDPADLIPLNIVAAAAAGATSPAKSFISVLRFFIRSAALGIATALENQRAGQRSCAT